MEAFKNISCERYLSVDWMTLTGKFSLDRHFLSEPRAAWDRTIALLPAAVTHFEEAPLHGAPSSRSRALDIHRALFVH
jgi:hypothetical protein